MAPPKHTCASGCPACAIGVPRVEAVNVDTYARMRTAEARVAELETAAGMYLRATGEEPAHVGLVARLARSRLLRAVKSVPSVGEAEEENDG
jgi:hypothetical protein